ncbi:hypothetical protein GCM10007079_49270 [Nocardiopsis terrae]|uniref:Acyl carrier protein n=1 Tax=Nocardiopsis terrae TaxID=372655 RepID=A0ABR9HAA9_9ACTN|nr:phosphopantetheine-binding protein [Nocardiopsis terrae]MBE1455956.1 acyl carrier protein [Nocardiopsis terrae]GHC96513.1 hypothetical protein GCM10007079_49270 [Nocardiopsis terrae]
MFDKDDVRTRIVEFLGEIYPDRDDISITLRMTDLDSFGIVQLLLALEEHYDVAVLEEMSRFQGEGLEQFADFFSGIGVDTAPAATE